MDSTYDKSATARGLINEGIKIVDEVPNIDGVTAEIMAATSASSQALTLAGIAIHLDRIATALESK